MTPEPAARDLEIGNTIASGAVFENVGLLRNQIAYALAAERARLLDLTPEEAGRLWAQADQAVWRTMPSEATIDDDKLARRCGLAFLAAWKALKNGDD